MSCRIVARRLQVLVASAALVLGGVLLTGSTVAAQESGSETMAPRTGETTGAELRERPEHVEEIVVTSRRREETLQATPIAITAFSETALRDQSIRRLEDVMQTTPNLMMDQAVFESNGARSYMRGVGNGNPGILDDNGTGIYVDGVYLPRAQGQVLAVSDILRVEVLRGPQGTLYGKNTIGGAINVVTQKPKFDFGGYGEVRIGNYHQIDTRFAVDVPIIAERLASRWSLATRNSEGYTENKRSHVDFNDDHIIAGRASFLYNAAETLELLLTVDAAQEPRVGYVSKCFFVPRDGFFSDASTILTELVRPGTGFEGTWEQQCNNSNRLPGDKVDVEDNYWKDEMRTLGTTLTATWDINENYTLKSLSARRSFDRFQLGEGDGTQLQVFPDLPSETDEQTHESYSEELTLNGKAFDGRLDFVLGGLWFSEANWFRDPNVTFPYLDSVVDDPATGFGSTCGMTGSTGLFCGFTLGGNEALFAGIVRANTLPPTLTQTWVRNKAWAGYTHFTYDLTEKLALEGGVRYTQERRWVEQRTERRGTAFGVMVPIPTAGLVTTNYDHANRHDRWTPMFKLTYQLNDDTLVYGGWARGFKSGIWDPRAVFVKDVNGNLICSTPVDPTSGACTTTFVSSNEATAVKPETLGSWEGGIKTSLFDNRLVVNAAYFRNQWEDAQLTVVTLDANGGVATVDVNAQEAIIHGFELELTAIPVAGLMLNGSLGLMAARYSEFSVPDLSEGQATITCAGCENPLAAPGGAGSGLMKDNNLPGTPSYQYSFAASYVMPLGSLGDLRSRVQWYAETQRTADILDQHWTRSPKHGELSARLALELADGVTEIALWGTNLLDRDTFSNAINVSSTSSAFRFPRPPRRFGVEIRREFGG